MNEKADDAIKALENVLDIDKDSDDFLAAQAINMHGPAILAALRLAAEVQLHCDDYGEHSCLYCAAESNWNPDNIRHAPDCAWLAWKEATE